MISFRLGDSAASENAQATTFHSLPSGLKLEVIAQKAPYPPGTRPPFVFIHGSYHAAWCWAEHWLPYFSSLGHDCYAISLLGQGSSDVPDAKVAGTVQTHAADVAHFIHTNLSTPPILVGHSFGGIVVQAYLADIGVDFPGSDVARHPNLAAAVLACSVPPTGNSKMVMRFLRTRPFMDTVKITWSLAAKGFATNTALCRESFFSPGMPDADVKRYQPLLQKSSRIPLFDLKLLNASLPVAKPPPGAPPTLVIGAENDFVVDEAGLQETAAFYGTPALTIPSIAHDIMLDLDWKRAAGFLLLQLEAQNVTAKTGAAPVPSS